MPDTRHETKTATLSFDGKTFDLPILTPTAGPEVPRCPRDDLPDRVQPVRTAGQRRFRFVAQIAGSKVWVGRSDIGRVGYDQVDRFRQAIQQAPGEKLHAIAHAIDLVAFVP